MKKIIEAGVITVAGDTTKVTSRALSDMHMSAFIRLTPFALDIAKNNPVVDCFCLPLGESLFEYTVQRSEDAPDSTHFDDNGVTD